MHTICTKLLSSHLSEALDLLTVQRVPSSCYPNGRELWGKAKARSTSDIVLVPLCFLTDAGTPCTQSGTYLVLQRDVGS